MKAEDLIENTLHKRDIFLETNMYHPKIGDVSEISSEEHRFSGRKIVTNHQLQDTLQPNRSYNRVVTSQQTEVTNKVWRTKFLRIIYYVSRFLQHVKQNSQRIKLRMITRKMFKIINDEASDFQFFINKRLINEKLTLNKKIKNLFYQLTTNLPSGCLELFPIIFPDSLFRMIFDTILVFTVMINIFYIPIAIAFDIQDIESEFMSFILNDFPSWILLLEIVFNFNTAFYDMGVIHTSRQKIFKHYIKGSFVSDVLITLPLIIGRFNISSTKFILLLRVTRIKEKFDNFEEILNLRDKFSTVLDLVRLIYFIMFVSHFCACGWYYLAIREEAENQYSWLSAQELLNRDNLTIYLYSLYYCTITITTVGYGDITPTNTSEIVFTIIMTLITCGVFGYAINNIGQIFKDMEEKSTNYKIFMAKVNRHLKRYNIGKPLSLQVRKYFEYYFKRQQENEKEVDTWFQHLPQELRKQVKVEKYLKVLRRSKYFRENISNDCLEHLCQHVTEAQYSTDDIIFKRNELTNKLFFLDFGAVKILYQKSLLNKLIEKPAEIVLRTFSAGYVICEKNFLLSKPVDFQASAAQHSVTVELTYIDFVQVLRQYPDDYERYCQMRDTLQLDQLYGKTVSVCEICSSNHSFKNCPYTFHLVNKYKIIQRQLKSEYQQRDSSVKRKFQRSQVEDMQQVSRDALTLALQHQLLDYDMLSEKHIERLGIILPKQINTTSLTEISEHNLSLGGNQTTRRKALNFERQDSFLDRINLLFSERQSNTVLSPTHLRGILQAQKSVVRFQNDSLSRSFSIESQSNDETQSFKQSSLMKQQTTIIPALNEYISDFERYHIYSIYKPNQNLDKVLKRLDELRFQRRNLLSSFKHTQVNIVLEHIRSFRLIQKKGVSQ